MKRIALFYHSEKAAPGFSPLAVGEGYTAFIRGEITPPGTNFTRSLNFALEKATSGENFMNSHYVSNKRYPEGAPVMLSRGELDTVLAGLRLYQMAFWPRKGSPEATLDRDAATWIKSIAAATTPGLSSWGIDRLCTRLNFRE